MNSTALRRGKRERWWAPETEEQRKLFELAKQDVVCYLSIMGEGLKCSRSYGRFAEYMENAIDFTRMGFRSFGEFLFHCDDCLEIRSDGYEYYLFIKGDGSEEVQEVAHIQDLVQNQRKPAIRRSFVPKHNNTFSCPYEKLLEIYYDLRIPEPEIENSFQNHNNNQFINRNGGGGFGNSRGGGNHGSYNNQGRGGINFGSQVNRYSSGASSSSRSFSFGSSHSSTHRPMSLMQLPNLEPPSSTTTANTSSSNSSTCFPTLKPLNQSAVEYLKRKNSRINNNNDITTSTSNNSNNSIMPVKTPALVLKPLNQAAKMITSTNTTTAAKNFPPPSKSSSTTKSETTNNNNNNKGQDSEQPPSLNLPARVISNINLSLASAVGKIPTVTNNNNNISNGPPPLRPLTSQYTSIKNTTTTAGKSTANINSSSSSSNNNSNETNRPANQFSPIISIPRLRTIVPKNRNATVTNNIPVLKSINTNSRENKVPDSEPITKVRRISLNNQPPPPLKLISQVHRNVSMTGDSGRISVRISNENSSDNNSNKQNTTSSQSQQQQQQLHVNPFYNQKIMTDTDTTTKMDIDQVDDAKDEVKSSKVSLTNHFTSTSTQSDMDDLSTKMAKGCSIVEKKKIYRRLKMMQMSLTMSRFVGTVVGADENGYIFVQLSDPVVQQSFNYFKADIQRFYGNSEHQDEYRMNPDEEIDQGIFAIVFLETSGSFIRCRIDEVCNEFCIVFDIDDCDFHVVSKMNVYHIHDSFTMRHPQAIMLIQKGTEEHMLNPKLNEILSLAFQKISPSVDVTDITAPHPIFRAPVACIKTDGKDLCEILNSNGLESLAADAGISSKEKDELLKILERKSHIVFAD